VVFGDSPETLLVNVPIPPPSKVIEFARVGFEEIRQQTPREITDAPPSSVIFPPLAAVVVVIDVIVVVDRVGTTGLVVKLSSFP
jgi:hypothetical protein